MNEESLWKPSENRIHQALLFLLHALPNHQAFDPSLIKGWIGGAARIGRRTHLVSGSRGRG